MNFKFGVLFAKDGQLTDDEMFSNGECPRHLSANRTPALPAAVWTVHPALARSVGAFNAQKQPVGL